jgi:hypothetical protein
MLNQVFGAAKQRYMDELNSIRGEDCDSTPTLKPGISGKSGRVKVGKHPTTVAKLNVEANMVKNGVKLAFECAFQHTQDRGDFHLSGQEGQVVVDVLMTAQRRGRLWVMTAQTIQ